MTAPEQPESSPPAAGSPKGRLARDLALYTVARLGLVAMVTAVILGVAALVGVDFPLIVALVFALVVAFPLSLVLFKNLRRKVNLDIAAVDDDRRRARADLHARLRGEQG